MSMIPKNIFQIYHNKSLVKESVRHEIISINPGYKYELYDFSDGKEFIKLNFESPLSEKINCYLDNLDRYAHKSDLLRYCLLYIYGGVYLDVDLKQKIPIDDIIAMSNGADLITSLGLHGNITRMNEEEFTENNALPSCTVANGLLITRPKNAIFLALIDKIITLPFKNRHAVNIYYFHSYLKNNSPCFGAYNNFFVDNINIYLFKEQTIHRGGKNVFLNKNSEIIMYSNNWLKKEDYLNT